MGRLWFVTDVMNVEYMCMYIHLEVFCAVSAQTPSVVHITEDYE